MSKNPETKFKEKVVEILDEIPGVWILKTQERARRGVPDLLICIRGRFVAIELKTDEGEVDPLQEVILQRIRQAQGLAFVTSPSRWPAHLQMIRDILRKGDF